VTDLFHWWSGGGRLADVATRRGTGG